MLEKRHGKQALANWQNVNESTEAKAREYEQQTNLQAISPVYHFDNDVRGGADLSVEGNGLNLRGYGQKISLDLPNKYADMSE